jgi:hypothetical protein
MVVRKELWSVGSGIWKDNHVNCSQMLAKLWLHLAGLRE